MTDIALIGKKIGMTREFYETGQSIPVTVLKMEKARVIALIDEEKRGYTAIQIGFGNIKSSKLSNQMKGFFAKKNTEPKKTLKEIRMDNNSEYKDYIIETSSNDGAEEKIAKLIVDNGIGLHKLNSLPLTLEEIFLQLTSE